MAAVASSPLIMDKLKGVENYNTWKFLMKMVLVHEDLWDFVEKPADEAKPEELKREQKALARIALSVQPSAFAHIRSVTSAHKAWVNLQKAYEDTGLCRRLGLLRTLFSTKLKECQSMENYINKITDVAQQLTDIKAGLDDDFIAVILLSGLPEDYDPLIMAIENSSITLSSEVVSAKLLQEKLRREDKQDSVTALAAVSKQPKCYSCKKPGHFKKDCPRWNKRKDISKRIVNTTKALLTALSVNVQSELWYVDSGATSHMCRDRHIMKDFVEESSLQVIVANGDKLSTMGRGTVQVKLRNGVIKTISDVYYVPNLTANLLSVSAMVNKGFRVVFGSGTCQILDKGVVVASAVLKNGTYVLDTVELESVQCNTKVFSQNSLAANAAVKHETYRATPAPDATTVATETVWHRRLAHLNRRSMELLKRGMVSGICYDDSKFEQCISCIEGKKTRLPFPKNSYNRATDILELIHTDLCGPMPCSSLSGAKYFLLFIDDYTRKTFVYFLTKKSEVFDKFKQFKVLVENQTNKRIKILRSDNGGEYTSSVFQAYLKANGIRHQTTVPGSPQQNGVAERANRTVLEAARCMLQDAGLKKEFWAEAVNTAVYIKNRCPTKAVMGTTPEEKWSGKKVSVSHFRIFGTVAYALNPNRSKLDSKCKSYIFVGYCEETKGYRLIDPLFPTKCIKAREVTFLENKTIKSVPHDNNHNESVHIFTQIHNDVDTSNETGQSDPISVHTETSIANNMSDTTLVQNTLRDSIIAIDDSDSSYEHDDSADETYIPEEQSTGSSEYEDSILQNFMVRKSEIDAPQTVQEALRGPDADHWKEAMSCEYNSFVQNKCWTLTNRQKSQKPVKCKWVFKLKRGLNGELLRYKARLVAKGCTQQHGIDYEETFSPVVRYSTIRTLLSIAMEYDMKIEHLDVKTAFLNGELHETVYMEQPEGFTIKGQENKVFKLNKAIYGLKQASKAWYKKIDHVLCEKLKFNRSSSEPCVYFKSHNESFIIIALYVDDIILFSRCDDREKLDIKVKLMKEFDITDLGPAHQVLGMRLCRDENKITLDQSNYIKHLLQKYKMEDCKSSHTPMETGLKLPIGNQRDDTYDYRGLIGSLMYIAVCTRPDIAYAVGYLSQFNESFTEIHWKAAKRVLRYLKGTLHLSLAFKRSNLDVTAYADADWGSNHVDRKSYTGYVFKIGESIVSWESRKQKTVALSSTEAEYIALSDSCKEGLFIRAFLKEIVKKDVVLTIYNDNQSAQKLCKNSIYHARTKHIDVRHHFIRQFVNNNIIVIKYLCTNDMLADILTKPLCKIKHNKFVKQLMLL